MKQRLIISGLLLITIVTLPSCISTNKCIMTMAPDPNNMNNIIWSVENVSAKLDNYHVYGKNNEPWNYEVRIFKPCTRVYIDTGSDDDDEVDVFNDGSLVPSLTFAELFFPISGVWEKEGVSGSQAAIGPGEKEWRLGLTVGLGLSSPADDGVINNDDETDEADDKAGTKEVIDEASSAPVVLGSIGLLFEVPIGKQSNNMKNTIGFEAGYAFGVTSSEKYDDINDSAVYIGLALNIPW